MSRSSQNSVTLLEDAHTLHQAGMLSDAVRLYRDALEINSDNPVALHDLGILFHELGLHREALGYIDRALQIAPGWASALENRGIVCIALGLIDAAFDNLDRAVGLEPTSMSAHIARGGLLCKLERYEDALISLGAAISLGTRDSKAFNNHGVALWGLNKLELALHSIDQALEIAPDNVPALDNRRMILKDLGRFDEALVVVDRILSICPDHVEALRHRATLLDMLGRFSEALACFSEALEIRPESAADHVDVAIVLARLGRHEIALTHSHRAIELQPDNADAHTTRSHILLGNGEFEAGWKEYEWRWATLWFSGAKRNFPQPLWLGDQAIDGKVILLHAEQGFGDTLQFCRYVPLVADRAQVVLEVPGPLVRLMRTLRGRGILRASGEELPPFDLHCPLLSLPHALGTTVTTLPADVPYLAASEEDTLRWQRRLADLPGLHIGIIWAGNSNSLNAALMATDRRRSIALQQLAPLGAVPGMSFISLQKGEAAAQSSQPPIGMVLHDWTDELGDFADTAALVAALDLVISVDTSVIHLAGALGKPVWMLNRFDSCWRWLRDRDDSPWYPTLRQFRQESPGDWSGVVNRICAALRSLTE